MLILNKNATATAQQKIYGDESGHSTTSTPWKFDAVRLRNSTALWGLVIVRSSSEVLTLLEYNSLRYR